MLQKRILLTVIAAMATAASYAQWSSPGDDIPAYHAAPPAQGATMAPILSGKQLTGESFRYAWQVETYKEAAKVPKVLYQLPCYCRCDRALGHQSLHSCFEGTHGAACSTCAKEAVYAYRMTQQGKSAKQIRDGILRKEYENINLEALGS
jgi:Protein of unknown function with PCYCGC motif